MKLNTDLQVRKMLHQELRSTKREESKCGSRVSAIDQHGQDNKLGTESHYSKFYGAGIVCLLSEKDRI